MHAARSMPVFSASCGRERSQRRRLQLASQALPRAAQMEQRLQQRAPLWWHPTSGCMLQQCCRACDPALRGQRRWRQPGWPSLRQSQGRGRRRLAACLEASRFPARWKQH